MRKLCAAVGTTVAAAVIVVGTAVVPAAATTDSALPGRDLGWCLIFPKRCP